MTVHPTRLTLITLAAAAAAAVLAPAATARGDRPERLESRLRGYNEVPAVSTAATGTFRATIAADGQSISYELSYSGLEGDVRQAHIHFGQHSVNGGIMVWLCQSSVNVDPTGLSPTCPQSGTVSGLIQAANVLGPAGQGVAANEFAEMLKALRGGVSYVNVHSSKFPGGEIRGQVKDD